MKNRREKGRALFYTRDSGGKHESTPSEYVLWAQRQADELGVEFRGTPEGIEAMIRDGQPVDEDLFLDFGVQGHILSRDGLNALIETASSSPEVSHILIPRRNRLARPNDPLDGINLENVLRRMGVTIVFMDRICLPLKRGKRPDISEIIVAAVDYDRSAEDRRELAQKVIFAQLHLAKRGYSTGGRPPYGFRRWLVREDGALVRELAEGERVRMRGHHVVWLSSKGAEWVVIRRILEMLEVMPGSRVAAILTNESVPTPDHDRHRTDKGVRHRTSGVWHQSMIISIARNPLLLAVVEHGRRSMGDQLRSTPDGPRELEDTDYREDSDKPKVIRNPEGSRITAPAKFDALVDVERHGQLLAKLDERGATQRGKPRSRDPNRNPLGCRVFDMNCGWPMYRETYRSNNVDTFRYKCGLYQQSHGAKCSHNHVDGPTAARFVLSCVRQRVLPPQRLQKLENRIRQLAAAEEQDRGVKQELACKRAELSEVEAQRGQASQNLARAKTDEQYEAISVVFDQLSEQASSIQAEIDVAEGQLNTASDADAAVEVAMNIIHQLAELARTSEDLGAARDLFELLNARLFLRFHQVKVKKRTLNKLASGVVTFGEAPPPIDIYEGPTSRRKIKGPAAKFAAGPNEGDSPPPTRSSTGSGEEGKSLGNVSRGDWIRTSDLLTPSQTR